MPKIPSHGWREAAKVLKAFGFAVGREHGSHIIFEKEGIARPVVLPKYADIDKRIIRNICNTARIDINQYVRTLTGEIKLPR